MAPFSFAETFQIALYLTLSLLIYAANLLVVVALRYMRTAKRATIVFLAHLAVCNLVQGTVFLLRGLFLVWPVLGPHGCLLMLTFSMGSAGAYVSGILFVYLDLFLALRRLSAHRPPVSSNLAIGLAILAWIFWIGVGCLGHLFRNDDWVYDSREDCSVSAGGLSSEYLIGFCGLFFVMFVVILSCHILTLRVMHRAQKRLEGAPQIRAFTNTTSETKTSESPKPETVTSKQASQGTRINQQPMQTSMKTSEAQILKKNTSMVQIIVVVLVIFCLCWYPTILTVLTIAICDCVPLAVEYSINMLMIVQYLSNGFIYLAKSREFQQAMKKLLGRCTCYQTRVNPVEEYSVNEPTARVE